MFSSLRVPCFLNTFNGHGDDLDNKELKLVFHIVGISRDLAVEISPSIADRLFRYLAGEYEVAKEISKVSFATVNVPMQNVTFHQLPEGPDEAEQIIPSVAISNLRATREGIIFRLEFDAVIPMDGETMRLVQRYYKSTVFLSMERVQRELAEEAEEGSEEVQGSLQDAADGKSAAAGKDDAESGLFINSRAKKRKGRDAESVN